MTILLVPKVEKFVPTVAETFSFFTSKRALEMEMSTGP